MRVIWGGPFGTGVAAPTPRCARWLPMCADRTEDDTFELTQECFAEMLGVPDSTWTSDVGSLQQGG